MKRSITTLLLFTVFYLRSQPPSWQWAQTGTCTTTDNGSSVATDNSGNVFTTGYFFGSNYTFGSTTLINAGNYDAYVTKHDLSGNLQWAISIGGAFDDVSNAIVCDNSGNTFVTGYYTSSTLAIGPYTLANMGGTDAYIAKIDPNGNVLWAKSFGDNMIEEPYGITSDGVNIFVTGQFQSNTIAFGTSTLTCNGGGDVFVLKYDNNGNEMWAKGFGDTGLDIGYDITTTGTNDIFITGSFKSPLLTFGTYTFSNMGGSDYFIVRYDASGNEIWAKSEGGNFDDAGTSVKEKSGLIYTTGYFKSITINFGVTSYTNASPTNADIFIVNYNSAGNEIWSRTFGGNLDDITYGVVTDPSGNIFIGGHIHSSSVTFDTYTLTCGGVGDGFIAKLNTTGNVTWSQNQGGLNDDGINDIAADQFYNVYVAGYYNSSSISFNTYTLNNNGNSDLFLAKLSSPPTQINETQSSAEEIIVYPNPSSSACTIRNLTAGSTIKLIDLEGKELLHYEMVNNKELTLITETISDGIYLLIVNNENNTAFHKLSIVH